LARSARADNVNAPEAQSSNSCRTTGAKTGSRNYFGGSYWLGGLLKKALTEREEKAALRHTLVEIERNAAELRRVLAHLVRCR
jgi:hypothetical protein